MSIYDGTPLQAAFDALAPTPKMWANAPEWAQWYAIDADAMAIWIDQSPFARRYRMGSFRNSPFRDATTESICRWVSTGEYASGSAGGDGMKHINAYDLVQRYRQGLAHCQPWHQMHRTAILRRPSRIRNAGR